MQPMKPMKPEPEYVAATLQWCNEHRAQQGQKALGRLPKGARYNGISCPCGRATGLFVGRVNYYKEGYLIAVTPEPVGAFVRAFDAGELPQYEEFA